MTCNVYNCEGKMNKVEKYEYELAMHIGKIGVLMSFAVASIVDLEWQNLSQAQRELVNYLAANDQVIVESGTIKPVFFR